MVVGFFCLWLVHTFNVGEQDPEVLSGSSVLAFLSGERDPVTVGYEAGVVDIAGGSSSHIFRTGYADSERTHNEGSLAGRLLLLEEHVFLVLDGALKVFLRQLFYLVRRGPDSLR